MIEMTILYPLGNLRIEVRFPHQCSYKELKSLCQTLFEVSFDIDLIYYDRLLSDSDTLSSILRSGSTLSISPHEKSPPASSKNIPEPEASIEAPQPEDNAAKSKSQLLRKQKRLVNLKEIDDFRKMYNNETLRSQIISNVTVMTQDTGFSETVMKLSSIAQMLSKITPYMSFVTKDFVNDLFFSLAQPEGVLFGLQKYAIYYLFSDLALVMAFMNKTLKKEGLQQYIDGEIEKKHRKFIDKMTALYHTKTRYDIIKALGRSFGKEDDVANNFLQDNFRLLQNN